MSAEVAQKAEAVDEQESIVLPREGDRALEQCIKGRMAELLPMAAKRDDGPDVWAKEYRRLARTLRELLDQKLEQTNVRVLDWPTETDAGRLWADLGVHENEETYVETIAYTNE